MHPNMTTAAAVLAVFSAFFWAQHEDAQAVGAPLAAEAEADQQDAEALSSRDWAARQVCNGRPFSWEDDKTLVCHREARP